jgi:AbrB family looped-hinge helix DNA binding protein
MRITTKGQVTIPVHIREKAGLMPNTEVEFAYETNGTVRIFRAAKKGKRKSRGEELIEHMRGRGDIKMTTEEIMALTRGE